MSLETLIEKNIQFNRTLYQANEANRLLWLHDLPAQEAPGFFLSSPMPVISATCAYVLFVTFIGPIWMRPIEPFKLRSIIRFYNLLEVFLAGYLLYNLIDSVGSFGNFFDCSKTFTFADQSATGVYQMANLIICVRLSEYMDTIFFTLRKKQNQITFLHVFHHAFVPLYAYWILRTAPLRFNVYIIYINSAIHVLMYFYYFLATFQNTDGDQQGKQGNPSTLFKIIKQLLKFKKYVTQLQILQFVSLNFYVIYAFFQPDKCGVPDTYILANFLLGFGFLSLFVHFYIRAYKQGQLARKQSSKRNE